MNSIINCFELIDNEFYRILSINQGIKLKNFNLRNELICDYSVAVEILSCNLDDFTSPLEKIRLFIQVIDIIEKVFRSNLETLGISLSLGTFFLKLKFNFFVQRFKFNYNG